MRRTAVGLMSAVAGVYFLTKYKSVWGELAQRCRKEEIGSSAQVGLTA